MDKTTKTKIIIGACFGIFVLLAVLVSVAFSKKKPKDNTEQEVSLRAERKNDFTTEDMMKAQENKTNYDNNASSYNNIASESSVSSSSQSSVPHYQDNNSEVVALQKQLRENKNQDDNTETNPAPTPVVNQKNKKSKVIQTKTVEAKEPIQTEPEQKVINPNGRSRNLVSSSQNSSSNLISAVIHNDQVIISGAKVKLRITENIVVNGVTIPQNSFVFGIATFSKPRMNITLSSLIVENNIIPFNKSVYDKDGMEGIYLPENVKSEDATEASNDMTNEALNTVSSSGIVGAALNAGKSIFRRKTQRQTVTLKANYKLFLK